MTTKETTQPLRVGIVGLGWAGETHLKAYQQQPQIDVLAVAGLETPRLEYLGSTYNVPHLYENYEDLIARDDLDIVSVCTPNFLHAPISIAALRSGKHVLCEKPLARSAGEAQTIVDAAIAANRVLDVAFNHRRRGDVQVLKRHIDTGALGGVYHAKANWLRRSGIPGLGSWFTNKEMAGGGPLIDLGVHMLDMALFLMGEPTVHSVSAATYAELGPRQIGNAASSNKQQVGSAFEVEDLATAFLRLEGGATLLLEASWATYRSAGDTFGVTLYGDRGGAEIRVQNYATEDTLRIYSDVGGVPAEINPLVTRGEGHVAVVRDFVNAIRGGDWAAHVGREGLRRSQIIDACYQSAREGREVLIEEQTAVQ